uniref:Fras1 related extracellular matrix 1b n=1 Tax=Paramormyrops kingsleyae TaxID=1676925 RepID=A0A3B3RES9_9TELE
LGFSSLLGLFPLCWAQSLVQLNVGLQVGRGQFVYVTGEDLRFDVQYNVTSCKVEVVMNEPVTQRVGVFTPQVFDCHFLPDEVKYTHNGSPLLQEDTVMLRIYRFTDSETFIEPVSVRVRVVEPHNSLIKFGSVPVEVQKFYGLSNTLDSRVLTFQNRPGYICNVRLLTSETNMPALGQLVTDDSVSTSPGNELIMFCRQTGLLCPGNKPCARNAKEVNFLKVNCEEFLNSHFKYQHLSPPSPETDYIPIRVELRDHSSRALLEAESVWIPVLIRGALQNQPPHAAFMSMFILEVDQFILTPMTTAALDAKDDETPQAQLVFNVTKPPSEGYITHLEDHTKPITSFTWQDLHEMKIAYQPPNCSHTGRRNYEVEFQAIDSTFVPSPAIMVHFSVRTAETNAPRVSWNMGMDLLEGQSRPITWENLQIVDSDNIGAVYLVAVEGPLHGQLSVRGGKGFMFKVHDLHEGVVVYHHSDSDTTRDHIVFRITDGQHSIRHRFPINILPKDDTPPILINNMALEVPEGGSLLLEEYMLLASDLDSSDDYILYQILTAPRAGEVIRRSSPQLPGVLVTSFLQRDLLLGLIYYRHLGDEVFEDSFDFILSDSHQPPNLSQRHTVVVHVSPVKDQLPHEVPGVVRSVTVKETEVIHLTQSHLHFRDPESPDTDLIYSITRPCFSPTAAWLADAGRLFYADSALSMKKDPALPVLKTFTQVPKADTANAVSTAFNLSPQHAVNHLKVGYMPPLEDIGPEPIFVQFVFSVSDQQGGALSGLVFNITVTPVDNQPPEIFVNLLRLEEGGGVFLTEEHILVRDADSRGDQLLVRLRTAPEHGRVELQGVPLTEGYSFTIQDLRMLRVRYTQGFTLESVLFLPVKILPVNDQPPLLGLGLRSGLTCKEGGRVQITGENLFATDADSDDARLSYMLVREPALGEIQRGGVMVDKFTQQDVIQELIFYVHTGGEIGPHPVSDPVTLIVSDGEAGAPEGCCHGDAPPVPLHGFLPVYDLNITVLPVNNQAPVITIGHMFMVDEGSVACLCGGFLGATDADSPQDQLLFSLDLPPEHGFIENTLPSPGFEKSNAGLGVVSFSFPHLSAGYINYVQARHRGVEATVDRFVVRVSDGVQKSAPVPFYVIINPTNDEEPSLLLGNFSVAEGGMKDLGPDLLDAVDLDVPADTLTFSVLVPPAHGMLLNGIYGLQMSRYLEMEQGLLQRTLLVKSFTIQQLRQGMKIIYMHDDTETFKDAFSMQLTDGIRAVQGTAHVRVLPVNDEKPWLRRNTGLELVAADRRVISSVLLEVEDADTPAHELLYVLSAGPRFGQLQLKVGAGWTDLRSGQNFTQEDVEMNRLWYQQTATQGLRGHDGFRFHLSDGDHMSAPHSFVISLQAMARGDLTLVTRPVTLTEGERAVLTTDVLMAADGVDRAEELVYVVLVPPEHGQLHTVQNPGVPLDTFTQLDVAALRVCYTHDNSRMASQDAFSFVISNGVASKNGTLLFLIRHGDRIPPTLTNNKGLRLTEGAVVPISPDALELTDPDTAAENLTYTLTQQPQHGKLLLRGHPLSQPRFTQADINNWDLTYQHQSGPAQADKFSFLPSDGTNTGFLQYGQLTEEAVTFTIQVEFVDRKPPGLVTKRIASVVENFPGGKQGIYITSRDLRASDPDSPDQELQFIILRPPHFGHLENTLTGGYIKGRFTQQDLNQRAVLYVIWPSVQGTEDSFEFQVSDPAGNSMPPEVLEVKWSRVEFSVTCFRVCENVGMLALQVTRTGNSVDPAYTGIQVENGTAKIGKDFTHSSANLIQFDPGVNVKTWNIYIKDDGLEETNEKFQVVLKGQKNTVLGQKNRTTIEIVDPRGGNCITATPPSGKGGGGSLDGILPSHDMRHLYVTPVSSCAAKTRSHQSGGRNLLGVQSAPQVHPELEIMPIWSWSSHHHRDQGTDMCPSGWTARESRCFILSHSRTTWSSAQHTCTLLNLTSVHSKQDMAWLWKFARKQPFWIGLTGYRGQWAWTDGNSLTFSRLKKQSSTEFHSQDRLGLQCVLVQNQKKWTPMNCTTGPEYKYICTVPAQNVPQQ